MREFQRGKNNVKLYYGTGALEGLAKIPDNSVHCCITSPPYWNLRDYGVDGQLGAEVCAQDFVDNLAAICKEIHRVLRDDGSFWLNLGDSYHSASSGKEDRPPLPQKSLAFIPQRVAIRLQQDGWVLRQEIIWQKSSCMPENVNDRFTREHESVFMFAKSRSYFFDLTATGRGSIPRTVWRLPPSKYQGSHSAVFPLDLVRNIVNVATASSCCGTCGEPVRKTIKKKSRFASKDRAEHPTRYGNVADKSTKGYSMPSIGAPEVEVLGEGTQCGHKSETVPCTVLDPFSGSGTTGLVSAWSGRDYIGIDLDASLLEEAVARISRAAAEPKVSGVVVSPVESPIAEMFADNGVDDA